MFWLPHYMPASITLKSSCGDTDYFLSLFLFSHCCKDTAQINGCSNATKMYYRTKLINSEEIALLNQHTAFNTLNVIGTEIGNAKCRLKNI